jgi:hypothetical protein
MVRAVMWLVEIVCSDEACAALEEVVVDDLDELERAACLCGCTFQVLRVSEVEVLAVHADGGLAAAA